MELIIFFLIAFIAILLFGLSFINMISNRINVRRNVLHDEMLKLNKRITELEKRSE